MKQLITNLASIYSTILHNYMEIMMLYQINSDTI